MSSLPCRHQFSAHPQFSRSENRRGPKYTKNFLSIKICTTKPQISGREREVRVSRTCIGNTSYLGLKNRVLRRLLDPGSFGQTEDDETSRLRYGSLFSHESLLDSDLPPPYRSTTKETTTITYVIKVSQVIVWVSSYYR